MQKNKQYAESPRALLVSILTSKLSSDEAGESLSELERLVTTLGLKVIARQSQRRAHTRGGTVVGEGKLKELAKFTGGSGVIENANFAKKTKASFKQNDSEGDNSGDEDDEASSAGFSEQAGDAPESGGARESEDGTRAASPAELATVVVFDCELTPSQMRNLEKALGVEVMDRTGVIIEIFSRHAKTRAARLQVEIARLNYLAPRLRETGTSTERQAGRGSGETDIELDRRNIRDRVTALNAELELVQKEQLHRRAQRAQQRCVALVGYTNAGKSSLMRALTVSEVLVEDKLFATLDTTVRALQPDSPPRILVSDTVGFIKKLPHDLVASFRSTLDEAHNAALLVYVVDASDPTFRSQLEVTREVLAEVGVAETPSLLVLNKIDRLEAAKVAGLRVEFPEAVLLSARAAADVAALSAQLRAFFEKGMLEEVIMARYDMPGIVGDIRAAMRVVREEFENEGVRMTVRAPKSVLEKLKKKYRVE